MEQVKLSSILETIKLDSENWEFLVECLKSNYNGVVNTEELVLSFFPLKNRRLLVVKLDNAKYIIFDIDSLESYSKDKVAKVLDAKFFNLLFHDSTSPENILNELEIVELPRSALKTIFECYAHRDGLSLPTTFELPVNDDIKLKINVVSGLIYFISKKGIEVSDFNLSPVGSTTDLIDDYSIKTRFIPRHIQDRKKDFNPDYSLKYGYKY